MTLRRLSISLFVSESCENCGFAHAASADARLGVGSTWNQSPPVQGTATLCRESIATRGVVNVFRFSFRSLSHYSPVASNLVFYSLSSKLLI